VCALAIHRASGRPGPFVAINCASLPAALVESELFGFVPGAHSTATAAKPGLVEAAEGGTLLLDEIGDMPPALQAKLFRFPHARTARPRAPPRPGRTDAPASAAPPPTPAAPAPDPPRPALVARLGADPVPIPPLRHRPEEIPSLIAQFAGETLCEIEPQAFRA